MHHKKKNKYPLLENIEITGVAAEGKALARHDGKVIFVNYAAPGDTIDVQITKQKSAWAEGRMTALKEASARRVQPRRRALDARARDHRLAGRGPGDCAVRPPL